MLGEGPSLLFQVRGEGRGPKGRDQGWCSWGEDGGRQPHPHQLGVYRSAASSPSRIWGGALGAERFFFAF